MSAIQRPIDAGGTGQHESQEVQQGQLPNPAPGTDQPSASVPAGSNSTGKAVGRAEPADCPGSRDGQ